MFNLAQQLLKRGYLSQLITSYPKFEVVKYGIPKDKIDSFVAKEILQRSWQKLPQAVKNLYNPQHFLHRVFDRQSGKRLKKADILVGGPSVFHHTMRKAMRMGMIAVVENGSAHTLYVTKVLKEEYDKFGIPPSPFLFPHPRCIEDDLQSYQQADYISVPSLFVKRTFMEQGVPENKLIHIPYGVDLSEFKQVPKKDGVFRVVFVGGMSLPKGVHYLLKAFSELNLPNAELLLIGSMSDEIKPFFRKYEGKFKWIGHVPQKELYKYYSQGSVFVIMSIQEGLALVQVQAMACGLPVIATVNAGAEDIVREGTDGFIIPIRDIEKLKEKLIYLYENPEICRQIGQSAKERVTAGFTWDDYGDKVAENYKKIIDETRSSRKN
ncbi:MAG: Glycosyl transferase group 1 [Candidatus Wolfebacteria bacterium GW2011_GWA1_44_24]|uniref:Glycosyl transferase group 1 n=1 Tax=Candidatus Wolfebacteria bacterium GW2011_GWB1_41_12 TaxID=1619006 RepID=A0A0G0UK51_9BACT|nr:MAG: Glycosyl transferase group 1 [Candidatus Wolfebacteria bacterium GW2011_GWB1_41_12]KKT56669.1 MAG: Glycosyl transferase group 1 [Candidatus Wolfebacteria bacterium GW2011_GWA1_44_24]